MARFIVTARSDGRGGFSPFVKHGSAHAGETVYVGGRPATVSSDGRVNIPASIMREVGSMGPDGRYRVAVEVGVRTDNHVRSVGLFVSTPPSNMVASPSGAPVPRTDAVTTAILPSETVEYYVSD